MKRLSKLFNSFFHLLSQAFFPSLCPICQQRLQDITYPLCYACSLKLTYLPKITDNNTLLSPLFWNIPKFNKAFTYFLYDKNTMVPQVLYAIKYHNHPHLAIHFGLQAAIYYSSTDFFKNIDLLIPLPLANKRLKQRGYNQSFYICQGIAKQTHIPIEKKAVIRTINNTSQTHLDKLERLNNVQNIFKVINPTLLENKNILLVDDVITTGATLHSCAKEIVANARIQSISIFSLACSSKLTHTLVPFKEKY